MSTLRSSPAASGSGLDVRAIREDFPFFETGIAYLDSANTSQRPRQVLEAMEDYFTQYNSNIHRAVYRTSMQATERYDETRRKFANSSTPVRSKRSSSPATSQTASTWSPTRGGVRTSGRGT